MKSIMTHLKGWRGVVGRQEWFEPALVGRGLLGRK